MLIVGVFTKNHEVFADNHSEYTLAFGSCARQDKPQPIWNTIGDSDPKMFLFIGDNIYADTYDPDVMQNKYQRLASIPEFKAFRTKVPILATWDDHDYGVNDAGSEYPLKVESQKIFLDFWQGPDLAERYKRKGVYHSVSKEVMGLKIQVIMLDTRYHRSSLLKDGNGYKPNTDPDATILGAEQWDWLKKEFLKPADIRIIASSIQFLSNLHPYEKWNNFPLEREKMFELIADTKANGVIFISGDRHAGEISIAHNPLIQYPIYDMTSSGLTNSTRPGTRREANPFRLDGSLFHTQRNFGIVKLKEIQGEIFVDLILKDSKGNSLIEHSVNLQDLKF